METLTAVAVVIDQLDPAGVARHRDDLVAVYRAAFALPPYRETEEHVAWFAHDSLPRHAGRDGFRCRIAREEGSRQIPGFAYGYTGKPGQWWRELVAGALDAKSAALWLPDYFEVVNLAVLPAWQGHGIGGRLHDSLLQGLPHRRALLSTHQSDTPALRLYRKRGWVVVLKRFVFPGSPMEYLIMGLDLACRSARSIGDNAGS